MKLVIQRVSRASVTVDQKTVGAIEKGFLVLVGIADTDTRETADKYLKKMLNLRIFEDENGKTNLSLKDVNGQLLLVSQFTLYADCRKGNRPSFIHAGAPGMAEELYKYMVEACRREIPVVEKGIFGADMKVELLNDGPFTIILDEHLFTKE
ncbi:MAG: D-aminoacyl-tRNA deacylase [Lachnospiraceae bacterium]|nr:D-aminoacyl-tRNA deacylase [Lachnospiraceae bacterium]